MSDERVSIRETIAAMPRAAWMLCLGIFINRFGTFVVPFFAIYLTRLGFTTRQAAAGLVAYGLGHLVACFIGGHLADTVGRRQTITLSMVLGAGAMMCLSQMRSVTGVVGCAFFVGMVGELFRPASSALLADLIEPRHRVGAYTLYRIALNAGFAFGPATAGFLARHSFFWLFAGDALTSLLFGMVAWFALPTGGEGTPGKGGLGAGWSVIRRDGRFLRLLLASLTIAMALWQMNSSFGLHVTACGYTESTYGLLLSLNGLIVATCELWLTTRTQHLPRRWRLGLGYLLIGLGTSLNLVAREIPLLLAVVVVFTLGEMLISSPTAAYVAELAPPEMRGRYMGFYALTWSVAVMCAPAGGLQLFRFSPALLWSICGGLGVTAALIIWTDPRVDQRG